MRKGLLLFAIIFCCTLIGGGFGSAAFAASDVDENFSSSYVLDDLAGAVIDGKVFNVNDYIWDVKGELRLIAFMEYAYSENEDLRDYYGLYFYVYNPRKIQFVDDVRNKVEIATEYKQSLDGLVPSAYKKLELKLCSISSERLFVKFRIDNIASIYERVSDTPGERRYDVAGIELVEPGKTNATDYKVGGTWKYSGYARGCGNDFDNTLQCVASTRQTLDLDDLHHTYYRNWIEEAHYPVNSPDIRSAHIAQQLNSVYFSVPTYYVEKYKRLYSIQAEMYRYLTSPVVVVQNMYMSNANADSFYNQLFAQRGLADPSKRNSDMSASLYWDYGNGVVVPVTTGKTGYNDFSREYSDILHTLAWVFRQDKLVTEVSVTADDMLRYAKEYSDKFGHEVLGKYSADLFADHYYSFWLDYAPFTNGFYPIDLDVSGDDDFRFTLSDSSQSFWSKFFNGQSHVASDPFSPIVEVHYDDIKGMSDAEISKKYLIREEDVGDFYNYVWQNPARTVYLFHFGLSDYCSTDVKSYGNIGGYYHHENIGFVAQEVTYLDFDIISMGYENDEGHIEILPVVGNPIDILSSIESGSPLTGWYKFLASWNDFWSAIDKFFQQFWWILVIAGVLVLLGVLSIFFPVLRVVFKALWVGIKWLFKILWYIISAPARLIVLIADKVKERKNG